MSSLSERVAVAMGAAPLTPGQVKRGIIQHFPDFEHDERLQGAMLAWLRGRGCCPKFTLVHDGWLMERLQGDTASSPTINAALCKLIVAVAEAGDE